MHLTSVNVGRQRSQAKGHGFEVTGIYKRPAEGPVALTTLGLLDDFIGDARNHGGPDQAVYVYGSEDYAWWATKRGSALEPGTFGENLTIAGLDIAKLSIGDRLHMGNTVIEVSAARIPCSTLSRRMGDVKFAAIFREAERPGAYCRVISPGSAAAGNEMQWERYEGASITILEMFRDHYRHDRDEQSIRRALAAPISVRARHAIQADLDRLLASQGN